MAETSFITGKTPRDFVRILFRRKRVFLLTVAVVMIISLRIAGLLPLQYTATAKLRRISSGTMERSNQTIFDDVKKSLNDDLAGRLAVEQAMYDLALDSGLPRTESGELTREGKQGFEDIVKRVMADTRIRWAVKSKNKDDISIEVTHHDPRRARDIPNQLIDNYIESIKGEITDKLRRESKFYEDKYNQTQKELEDLRATKHKAQKDHVGLSREIPLLQIQIMQNTQAKKEGEAAQLAAAKKNLARIERLLMDAKDGKTPEVVQWGPNPELDRLVQDRRQLQERLEMLRYLKHMTDVHPEIQGLLQSIELMEKRIKETPPMVKIGESFGSGTIDAMAAEIEATNREIEMTSSRLKHLTGLYNGYVKQQAELNALRDDYVKLLDEIDIKKMEVAGWNKQYKEAKSLLGAELGQKNNQLIPIKAREPLRPSGPSLFLMLAGSIGGGLVAGLGLVFLLTMLDRTVSTADEIERYFGVACHGSVREITTRRERRRRSQWRWLVWPVFGLAALVLIAYYGTTLYLRLAEPVLYDEWQASAADFIRIRLGL